MAEQQLPSDPLDLQLLFFSALFEPSDTILLRPIETWNETDHRHSRVVYRHIKYPKANPPLLFLDLQRLRAIASSEKANLFFGVCPRFGGKGQFDQAWQIRTVRSLWTDIDHISIDAALEKCEAAKLPSPSIVVNSGNGGHLYWLLEQSIQITDVDPPPPLITEFSETELTKTGKRKPLRHYFDATGNRVNYSSPRHAPKLSQQSLHTQDILQGLAASIGGDATHDLSRLLRIPATLNRKDERNGKHPVEAILLKCDKSLRYPISLFERFAADSPDANRRRKIYSIQLPVKQSMTPKRRERINQLLNACAIAEPGQRSELDFSFCAYAIRIGMLQSEAWNLASSVGKFSERGEAYFERTWQSAVDEVQESIYTKTEKRLLKSRPFDNHLSPSNNGTATKQIHPAAAYSNSPSPSDTDKPGVLSNAICDTDDDSGVVMPLPMKEIVSSIFQQTNNWPRRVGNVLFIHENDLPIHWLPNSAALFGWLSAKCGTVKWYKGVGCCSKDEVFQEICRMAVSYKSVESLPHEPPISGHYYACPTPAPSNGNAILHLVNQFCPETEEDRQLILAMFATAFWGGPGGSRPLFVITSDAGRGVGKSKITDMLAQLVDGLLELSPSEESGKMRQRLLSPEGLNKRLARLDNVKSLKFSWSDFESIITSQSISGHRMYHGESTRPNTLAWAITLNGISFGTDIAQRSVIIKLARPTHGGAWEAEVSAFIDANRQAIIADLITFLKLPKKPLSKHTRWATWETEIVSRLYNPLDIQQLVIKRSAMADVEADELDLIESYFGARLLELGYQSPDRIHVPMDIASAWFNASTGEKLTKSKACRVLNQFIGEGNCKHLTQNASRKYGRGLIFSIDLIEGQNFSDDYDIHYDLGDKISNKNLSSNHNERNFSSNPF